VSAIPPPLARKIDRISRVAHRFHRWAHHPLCESYSGEVIRLGRRARVCRGCVLASLGAASGLAASLVVSIPTAVGCFALFVTAGWVSWVTSLRGPARPPKLATRFAPAFALAIVAGNVIRVHDVARVALSGLAVFVAIGLLILYRRRGGDRTPCIRCPERSGSSPCSGYAEIVRTERAFRRIAARHLSRAGL
jgi:hypothetical protein